MELYASTIGVGTGGLRGISLPLPLFFAKLDMTIRIEDNLFFLESGFILVRIDKS